ncbi:hypothetical protein SNEBB_006436 [Seison nebaliae]|nr:hypothetical protein SNEBB_006436 [Seison nebaliae]
MKDDQREYFSNMDQMNNFLENTDENVFHTNGLEALRRQCNEQTLHGENKCQIIIKFLNEISRELNKTTSHSHNPYSFPNAYVPISKKEAMYNRVIRKMKNDTIVLQPYDADGAMQFIISVILVYAFAIILMVGSNISCKTGVGSKRGTLDDYTTTDEDLKRAERVLREREVIVTKELIAQIQQPEYRKRAWNIYHGRSASESVLNKAEDCINQSDEKKSDIKIENKEIIMRDEEQLKGKNIKLKVNGKHLSADDIQERLSNETIETNDLVEKHKHKHKETDIEMNCFDNVKSEKEQSIDLLFPLTHAFRQWYRDRSSGSDPNTFQHNQDNSKILRNGPLYYLYDIRNHQQQRRQFIQTCIDDSLDDGNNRIIVTSSKMKTKRKKVYKDRKKHKKTKYRKITNIPSNNYSPLQPIEDQEDNVWYFPISEY